jgi:hypothetical protein
MPNGYGADTATRYLTWGGLTAKLVEAKHYWLASTRADGRPHVVPRWGVWLDDCFWYDGSPATIHVQNLERDPSCVLHLEDGWDVTIVEGKSLRSEPIIGEMGERLAGEYARKYGPDYTPAPDAWSDDIAGGMRVLRPEKVLAWSDFPNDVTRFTF